MSLYLPLDPKHPSIEADRLMLKDLVRDARHQLDTTTQLRRSAIDELLAPAEALLAAERWPLGCRGYALFSAAERSIQLRLDVDVPLIAVVADRFVVTPLVGTFLNAEHFYLLAVSQNAVRFFRGRRDGLIDVDVPDLPVDLADALQFEHHERQLNVHGGSHQGVDRITGTLHGSPSGHDLRREQLLRFFRVVDGALWHVLRDEIAPLLVAGVDFELAIYREANRYPHLAATIDTGNPERLGADELLEKVWPAAAGVLDAPRRALIERVATATPLTTIPAILDACREGRVEALLVQPDRLSWGRLDAPDGRLERRPGDIDLVSATISAALDQSATIHPAAPGELPDGAFVAAVARF